MPRERRKLVDGGIYHVIARGHNRSSLFEVIDDYEFFYSALRRFKEIFPFDLYHYCLMPNHFHLLLKIDNSKQLPKLLKSIAQSYSFYVRRKYDRVGYIFQGRYKSLLIESDSYLLECGRYIERNPVRAGLVNDPMEYRWSSYKIYSSDKIDPIIALDPLYMTLGKNTFERQKNYKEYLLLSREYELLVDKALGLKMECP